MTSTFTDTLATILLFLAVVAVYGTAMLWVVADCYIRREDRTGRPAPHWCWTFLDMWGLL